MLVWVVDIMWKSLLFDELDLLYKDNLIKCETILKSKNIFILMVILKMYFINIFILFFFIKLFV
jgi:hypothetical protein